MCSRHVRSLYAKGQQLIIKLHPIVAMLRLGWQAYPTGFCGALLLNSVQSLVPIAQAWITKLIFDQLPSILQVNDGVPPLLWILLIGRVGLNLILQILSRLSIYLGSEVKRRLSLNVKTKIFNKINNLLGLAPFENPKTHNIIKMAAQGAQRGPGQTLGILTNLIKSTFTLISFLGLLIPFNMWLALLVSLTAIPNIYAHVKMGQNRFRLSYENTPNAQLIGYLGSLLSRARFVKEIRLFNLGNYFLDTFRKLSEEIQQSQRTQQKREVFWQTRLSLLSIIVSSTTFISVILRAAQGHLTIGDVTLYSTAVDSVQGAISGIVIALGNLHENTLFFSSYTDLMHIPQPIDIPTQPRPVPKLQHSIQLNGISFRYSDDHPWVLKDVTLTIPVGTSMALVGLNGAGKTTIVKLLTRMYDPTEGNILWDGIDIRKFDPIELRSHIGAIFQDFVRFALSARENIALGDISVLENSSETMIETTSRKAAMKAGIHKTISTLPKGYSTILSRWLAEENQGINLSGGEWQKLALARLFMREKADFLILDEPTAAIDAQAEHEFYNRFVELVDGRTSLLISHRFSTVRMADEIAVLINGHIGERGSHGELLKNGGKYAQLYTMQATQYQS